MRWLQNVCSKPDDSNVPGRWLNPDQMLDSQRVLALQIYPVDNK